MYVCIFDCQLAFLTRTVIIVFFLIIRKTIQGLAFHIIYIVLLAIITTRGRGAFSML